MSAKYDERDRMAGRLMALALENDDYQYAKDRQSFAEIHGFSLTELDKEVNAWRANYGRKPFNGNIVPFNGRQSPSGEPLEKPSTLPTAIDVARDPIPPRDWAVRDRIPARNVSLLSGEGAIGKSILLLQLAASTVLARDWLGTVPEPGAVMYLSCEDDDAEIRRRLEAIASHYHCSRGDMMKSGLHVFDFVGKDAVLGQLDRSDRILPTPLFQQIKAEAIRIQPKLVIIDTVADVFAGNENNRSHTRQFIGQMRGLAVESRAAVVMASHPSLTGISSDSGMSGSTAWHNGPRARGYFKKAPDVEDNDLRVLEWKKNNYGPTGENILLRWRNGVYVPEPGAGSLEQLAADAKAENLFLDLLARFNNQDRNVNDKTGPTFAPTLFAQEAEAKAARVGKKALADAMRRLFASNRVHLETYGKPSRQFKRLVPGVAPEAC